MEVTVQMSPAAKKVYEYSSRPKIDLLLYHNLKDTIIRQLKGCGHYHQDLNKAVELLTELNAEIYRDYPSLVTPFRVKDGYLWFLATHNDGTRHWHTVAGHNDVYLTEKDVELISEMYKRFQKANE